MRRPVLVALGGAAGAAARALVVDVVPSLGALPVATLLVNLTGAFALGLLLGRPHVDAGQDAGQGAGRDAGRDAVRNALLGAGFLGAFTTFSAFAVQLAVLPVAIAVGYALMTVAGGLALAWAGLARGRRP